MYIFVSGTECMLRVESGALSYVSFQSSTHRTRWWKLPQCDHLVCKSTKAQTVYTTLVCCRIWRVFWKTGITCHARLYMTSASGSNRWTSSLRKPLLSNQSWMSSTTSSLRRYL